ncbi:MAG: hypothetical protein WD205_08010 [Rhodothermales bacterium]
MTKIVLVQFRSGEAVSEHPELVEFLADGWTVRSAVPRMVEAEGTKLLVVLARPNPVSAAPTIRTVPEARRTVPDAREPLRRSETYGYPAGPHASG